MIRLALATAFTLIAAPAFAHVGIGDAHSFTAGAAHPFSGLDHIAAMVAVGLWAALKGGRALWVWPLAFVGVMLAGGALGVTQVSLPFVEPAILASIVALGLLVALAIDLPVAAGAAIIGAFALFHGYAHGAELPENAGAIGYMAGFAVATAILHGIGLGIALSVSATRYSPLIRLAGAACVVLGIALTLDLL